MANPRSLAPADVNLRTIESPFSSAAVMSTLYHPFPISVMAFDSPENAAPSMDTSPLTVSPVFGLMSSAESIIRNAKLENAVFFVKMLGRSAAIWSSVD